MLPSTAASLFAFILFVAPGFVYQARREKLIPRAEETAFREITGVVLASLACSGAALVLLAVVRAIHGSLMPEPHDWLMDSHAYLRDNWALVARFFVLQVGIGGVIAYVAGSLARPEDATGDISPRTAWWAAFRGTEPDKAKYASVRLHGGARYFGIVEGFTPSVCAPDERELALKHPGLSYAAPDAENGVLLESQERAILNGANIESLTVKHLARKSAPRTRRRWWRKWWPWVWATKHKPR